MARRRRTELDLNFDSLTDLVTNLAGGFILLVLLLMGVTRPASSQNQTPPPPPPSTKEKAGGEAEQKSMAPLLARVNQLKAHVRGVDQEIDRVKADLPALKDEVEALIRKAEAIQPPKPVKEEGDKPQARTVPFRPPMERKTAKSSSIAFVCQDSRIYIYDFVAGNQVSSRETLLQLPLGESTITVPRGDFDLRVLKEQVAAGVFSIKKVLTRKMGPEHRGETLDAIKSEQSRFQRTIAALDPNLHYLQFAVYPDSFDAFRFVRDIAYRGKYEVQWVPRPVGGDISLGIGEGAVQ